MKTNYVLIDYESVHVRSLEELTADHFNVFVFVGASQGNLPYELAQSVHQLGSRAQYVKISSHGRDALDFHIAYYIGRLAVAEPSAYFHIISKDKGFDPLIQHLKSNKIFAGRVNAIADIPVVKASNCKSPHERIAFIVAKLKQLKAAKPGTIKTLHSSMASWFQNHLSAQEIASLFQSLVSRGYVQVAGAKITYTLPANSLRKS